MESRDAEGALVQVGVNHVKYHAFSGRSTITKDAVLVPEPENEGKDSVGADADDKEPTLQTMTCVQFADTEAVVGTINGDIYRFAVSIVQETKCVSGRRSKPGG